MSVGSTLSRWRAYLFDGWPLFLGCRRFSRLLEITQRFDICHSALEADEAAGASVFERSAAPRSRWFARRGVIIITPADVKKIATTINNIPSNFDPVRWLQEKWEDISIVATEAAKDVVWEALAIGLADHPLVLAERESRAAKDERNRQSELMTDIWLVPSNCPDRCSGRPPRFGLFWRACRGWLSDNRPQSK